MIDLFEDCLFIPLNETAIYYSDRYRDNTCLNLSQ